MHAYLYLGFRVEFEILTSVSRNISFSYLKTKGFVSGKAFFIAV